MIHQTCFLFKNNAQNEARAPLFSEYGLKTSYQGMRLKAGILIFFLIVKILLFVMRAVTKIFSALHSTQGMCRGMYVKLATQFKQDSFFVSSYLGSHISQAVLMLCQPGFANCFSTLTIFRHSYFKRMVSERYICVFTVYF